MKTCKFLYWIYGDDVDMISRVGISSEAIVSELKKAIKNEKSIRFRDVDAHMLDLYSMTAPDDDQFDDKLREFNPQGKTRLSGRMKLSTLMNPEPNDNELVLIIVKAPEPVASRIEPPVHRVPDMALNCYVRGQDIDRGVFRVNISRSEDVMGLKDAIKNVAPDHFRDIEADTLALYKVSLPYDEGLKEKLEDMLYSETLSNPFSKLLDLFPEPLLRDHIHVVVEAPLSSEFQSRLLVASAEPFCQHDCAFTMDRRHLLSRCIMSKHSGWPLSKTLPRPPRHLVGRSSPSPSVKKNLKQLSIVTGPTTLRPRFLRRCFTLRLANSLTIAKSMITQDDNALALRLNVAMANFHSNGCARAQAIRGVFSEWGLDLVVSETPDGYATHGDISVDCHRCAIAEFTNEVASSGVEPYNKAVLSYLELTKQFATTMGTSPLPCIIILLLGPYIAFAGATWNLRPVVQPLSYSLPMYYHSTDTEMRIRVARHLGAFKKAVRTLEEYYRGLRDVPPVPSANDSQLFPYPTHFTSLHDTQRHHFEYLDQPFKENLLFFGALSGSGDEPICIKFVRRYSMDAHMVCASLGFAPKLRGFEEIPGGWIMVVMDVVPSDEYVRFYDSNLKTQTMSLTGSIRHALEQLHDRGYVHGDVRDVNILVSVSDGTQFMFVDFDWAGKVGEARYPMNVTRAWSLWRPSDAVDGALIKTEHDMAMLDEIEMRYRIKN